MNSICDRRRDPDHRDLAEPFDAEAVHPHLDEVCDVAEADELNLRKSRLTQVTCYASYLGGSKPAAVQRSAMAGPVSAAMKARAAAGSALLAGIAAA